MHKKHNLTFPIIFIFLLLAGLATAQTTVMEGTVKVKTEAGTLRAAAGATVDIYRLDIKGHWATKTDASGMFVRLGLPLSGTYLVVASGPGMQATWVNNISLYRNRGVDLVANQGDGRQMSLEEVREAIAQGSGSAQTISSSDKAKAESAIKEYEAKLKQAKEMQASFDVARIHYSRGIELTKAMPPDFANAVGEFEEAAKIDPTKHAALAEIYYKSKANLSEAHYQIGTDLFNNQDKDGAKRHFESAIAAIKDAISIASGGDLNVRNDLLVYYSILAKNAKILIQHYQLTDLLEPTLKALETAESLDLSKDKWEAYKAELIQAATPTPTPTTTVAPTSPSSQPGKDVKVRQYTRKDGTVVRGHTRSAPKRKP